MIRNAYPILLLLIGFVIFSNCNKEETIPEVSTSDISLITQTSAVSGGTIVSDGNSDILEVGIVWGENDNPTVDDNKIIGNNSSSSFSVTIDNLQPNKIYFIKAYAKNSIGYGNVFTQFSAEPVTLYNHGRSLDHKMISVDEFVIEANT